ncbi:uncharacterized protein LOC129619287 [Condylostylus longicornis]|uniref:uncharacterized protein LOC129619287 n=1 Tax=Condylostylus longicornis TaxID=2530218 RepID=UPI00244DB91A|nr:uncharacterized protein LOC129619287 [Condylostylus longicornis]
MPLGKFGKIAIGWSVITFAGIYAFVLSKNSIEQRRIESMKVRDRMRKSNYGDYEQSERKF